MTNVQPGDLARAVAPSTRPGATCIVIGPPVMTEGVRMMHLVCGRIWKVRFSQPYPWPCPGEGDPHEGYFPDALLRRIAGLDARPTIVTSEKDGRFTI